MVGEKYWIADWFKSEENIPSDYEKTIERAFRRTERTYNIKLTKPRRDRNEEYKQIMICDRFLGHICRVYVSEVIN